MGLLDDAIREHLDLKRARGGDPAEIERMEREALGPVRREPTIGSTRFEAREEHAAPESEIGYPDDRDQLLGYPDSTAPHAHPHHAEPHHEHADPYYQHVHEDPFAAAPEEAEQPRRRFLRRSRAASQSDIAVPEPGFHEEPAMGAHELLEHGELGEHHEPLGAHEPYGHAEPHGQALHHESLAHHDLHGAHEASESPADHDLHEIHEPSTTEHPEPTPPHLQFEHPPKRPRFTAEPPSLRPETEEEPATGTHEPAGAAPAHPAEQPEPPADTEVQETTEFDVQQHIAETRFQPDPEPHPAHPAPAGPDVPADEQEHEDVLEETPEFLQDTPEHDRLWFEQRPPRDFDFDG